MTAAIETNPVVHPDLSKLNDENNHQTDWLTQVAADCYHQAKALVSDPYVEGAAAIVGTVAVLALNRKNLVSLAGRFIADAAESGVAERTAAGATGVVARDAGGTAFVFREKPLSLGEQFAGGPTAASDALSESALAAKNWVGKDGAQYAFKGADLNNQSWHHIYEKEFPADERQDYAFLESLGHKNALPRVSLQLTERNGKTAAFSMISDYGEGTEGRRLLLPYIAVEKPLQGMGIGSKQMQGLVSLAKEEFPSAKGIAVEVEDPAARGITAEQVAQRMQRVDWYVDRHGAKLLDTKYLIPSSEEGAAPLPARLLWIDFGRGGATDKSLHSLISSIYKHGYELEENDPVVKEVLGKYSS